MTSREIVAVALHYRFGMLSDQELDTVAADPTYADLPMLVRWRSGDRQVVAARAAKQHIEAIERDGRDHVRDVSLCDPTGERARWFVEERLRSADDRGHDA